MGTGLVMAICRKGLKHDLIGHLKSGAQHASRELSIRSPEATKAMWSARASTRTESQRSEAPPAGVGSLAHFGSSHQLGSVGSTIERP
eukprot:7866063-Pyramimonas_sp.AAC.1